MVADVRRFNRTVTERVGALNDRYLARERPLGEARVLWEIGPEGCERAGPCARASSSTPATSAACVRSLEADGLVAVAPATADRRTRVARLTARRPGRAGAARRAQRRPGRVAAWRAADRRPARAARVAAMREVERLLTAALVEIAPADPADPDARRCLAAYFAELDRARRGGLRSRASARAPPATSCARRTGSLLLARLRGRAGRLRRRSSGSTARRPRSSACGSPTRCAASASARRLLAELEGRARGGRRRGRAARHQPQRSPRPSPCTAATAYREVAAVQRRALRAPLVREAALTSGVRHDPDIT